jgi:hypothetical protein
MQPVWNFHLHSWCTQWGDVGQCMSGFLLPLPLQPAATAAVKFICSLVQRLSGFSLTELQTTAGCYLEISRVQVLQGGVAIADRMQLLC